MASWPRLYLRFWTLLCSKSLAVSPILHSNNNISESPGINKARATLRHRNPFNDSSLKVRKLEWVSSGLSESCHHRVIGVLTCDQPPAHVSPVLCCVVKAVSDPCVLYLGCLHHASGRAGGQQCKQLSHGCTQATREDYVEEDVCCFVNIHGPEYFVSQQLQMILSMAHLVVYIDIE